MADTRYTPPERQTDQELLDLLHMIDANGDHKLSRAEFGEAIIKRYAAQFPNEQDPLKALRADLALVADRSPAKLAPGDTRDRAQDIANLDKENARGDARDRLVTALEQAMIDPDKIAARLGAIGGDMKADAAQERGDRQDARAAKADEKFDKRMATALGQIDQAGAMSPELRAAMALLTGDAPAVKPPETTVVHENISQIGKQLLQYKPSDVNRDLSLDDIVAAAGKVPTTGGKGR